MLFLAFLVVRLQPRSIWVRHTSLLAWLLLYRSVACFSPRVRCDGWLSDATWSCFSTLFFVSIIWLLKFNLLSRCIPRYFAEFFRSTIVPSVTMFKLSLLFFLSFLVKMTGSLDPERLSGAGFMEAPTTLRLRRRVGGRHLAAARLNLLRGKAVPSQYRRKSIK